MKNFYISIERLGDVHLKFHLERLASFEQANDLLDNFIYIDDIPQLVVTDDKNILAKYKAGITEHDLRAMCDLPFSKSKITLNPVANILLSRDIFNYFELIKNRKILSAHTSFRKTYFDYEEYETFDKWEINRIFWHTKMPDRYRTKEMCVDEKFSYRVITVATLNDFNKLLNVDILSIGTSINLKINWEYIDGILRYYDPITKFRVYIMPEILENLKKVEPKANIALLIKTRTNEELYVEYVVDSFYIYEEFVPKSLFDFSCDDDLPF
ncbi:MAG TPA: hypothetical protein PLD18_11300 [Flavobacterium sp.]|nr:hypothetical protein [Flavobacterium sp.]